MDKADLYRAIVRATAARSPSDTLGNGLFAAAKGAFQAGRLEEAGRLAQEFTRGFSRNLHVDDALEMTLWIRDYRDFDGQPLIGYARALAHREAGRPDSAAAAARETLRRYPGAGVRDHLRILLAEVARDRGDHAEALAQALAVADSTSKSRLAPRALQLAGEEAIAAGQGLARALRYYQEILERYPDSPLAPEVRAQILEMRRRLQL
jgi:TolA-binding protein